MVRLQDIADDLNLSRSTVSRVLNNKGRIGEETRKRVLEHAKKSGYHPNRVAQNLKQQRSGAVGIVIPDISNEFFSNLFRKISTDLYSHGLQPILFDTDENPENEEEYIEYLQTSVVDGMIVATSGADVYRNLPPDMFQRIVFIDNLPALERECLFIGSDNRRAAKLLTEHMLDLGHENIATIVGTKDTSSATDRLLGLKDALAERDLELPKKWVIPTNFQYAEGYEAAMKLLRTVDRPSAIIAQNNVLAYAAIRVANELGLQVPGALSIACFDHVDVYGFISPVVTSVVQSMDEMAHNAVAILLHSLEGDVPESRRITIPAAFRPGETTGPPNIEAVVRAEPRPPSAPNSNGNKP